MLSNKNLPRKKKVNESAIHFSDTSMANNVKAIKSGVWTDQAKQDWYYIA